MGRGTHFNSLGSTLGPGAQDSGPELATRGPNSPALRGPEGECCFPASPSLQALPPHLLGLKAIPGRGPRSLTLGLGERARCHWPGSPMEPHSLC